MEDAFLRDGAPSPRPIRAGRGTAWLDAWTKPDVCPPWATEREGPIVDPKVGDPLRTTGRPERDLIRLLILDGRVEAIRPTTAPLTDGGVHPVCHVAATFDNRLLYHVIVEKDAFESGRLREELANARRRCRLAGGRLLVWTASRIERVRFAMSVREDWRSVR